MFREVSKRTDGHTHTHTDRMLCVGHHVQFKFFIFVDSWSGLTYFHKILQFTFPENVLPCTCFMCTDVKWCSWHFIRTWTCQKDCFLYEHIKVSINIEVLHTVNVVTDKLTLAHACSQLQSVQDFSLLDNRSPLLPHRSFLPPLSKVILHIIRLPFPRPSLHSLVTWISDKQHHHVSVCLFH
jgi:hypothetical protein